MRWTLQALRGENRAGPGALPSLAVSQPCSQQRHLPENALRDQAKATCACVWFEGPG